MTTPNFKINVAGTTKTVALVAGNEIAGPSDKAILDALSACTYADYHGDPKVVRRYEGDCLVCLTVEYPASGPFLPMTLCVLPNQ